jgi:hypothetical protein
MISCHKIAMGKKLGNVQLIIAMALNMLARLFLVVDVYVNSFWDTSRKSTLLGNQSNLVIRYNGESVVNADQFISLSVALTFEKT